MKVLLINTSERTGGAAIACYRLMEALNANGVEAKMLVRDKQTDNVNVISVNTSGWKKLINKWRFIWERIIIFLHNGLSKHNLFKISIANTGTDISRHPLVREADIIHLHWVNQGFLSIKDIEKLSLLGKPIVWTMHDMWPCTGICHHSRECNAYHEQCQHCFYFKNSSKGRDLSFRIFLQKKHLSLKKNIHYVTCSLWLRKRAEKSLLLTNHACSNIPNPININLYQHQDKNVSREKLSLPQDQKLILFGSAKITDERKGIAYMVKACEILHSIIGTKNVSLVVFGAQADVMKGAVPFNVYPLNYLSRTEDIVNLYNAVDIFVTPSLDENLPNTIMEAMACGTPCVGFNTGGIPEMIDHKVNGYVACYKDAEDLANGIHWVLEESDYLQLSQNARKKVEECYSEDVVVKQYKELYQKLWHETES